MQAYRWKGILKDGTPCNGKLEAESYNQVKEILLSQGIALLDCSQSRNLFRHAFFQRFFVKKITLQELLPFFEHMSILLKSGIPLLKGLTISTQQLATKPLQATIKQVSLYVEKGASLAHALQQYPTIFNIFIIQLISAGEQAGKLGFVFENLTLYAKNRIALEKKIKQATLLPLITLGFALCIFVIIFALIIPQFSTLFASLNKPLPALTKTVLALSACFTIHTIVIFLGCLGVLIFITKKILEIKKVKFYKDKLIVQTPLLGSIVLLTNLVRFLQIVSMFLKSGISLPTALEKARHSITNTLLRENINTAHHAIIQGKSLEQAFSTKNSYVPTELIALMSVGEKTGTLEIMLDKASEFFQERLSTQLDLLTTVIQPVLLLITGIIVAGLMLAVYLPIFSMASVL